ncbi:MAG TPA: (2Fe-2S) ferredoxin domain-containing protein [Melioribacteraceae bacterium]|nr:(2Fe-2S) ferredoxin domain-containing protein [Melioribacteraceae bacterium]
MKHKIKICMGSSCFARGNQKNLDILENIISNEDLDVEIELTGSRCENRCSNGPNIEINGKLYNKIDSGSLIDILNKLILKEKQLHTIEE